MDIWEKEIAGFCQAWVVQACNPSCLGGRDQEDHSSRPAWAEKLERLPSQT
jgi:hypothetical protein